MYSVIRDSKISYQSRYMGEAVDYCKHHKGMKEGHRGKCFLPYPVEIWFFDTDRSRLVKSWKDNAIHSRQIPRIQTTAD